MVFNFYVFPRGNYVFTLDIIRIFKIFQKNLKYFFLKIGKTSKNVNAKSQSFFLWNVNLKVAGTIHFIAKLTDEVR